MAHSAHEKDPLPLDRPEQDPELQQDSEPEDSNTLCWVLAGALAILIACGGLWCLTIIRSTKPETFRADSSDEVGERPDAPFRTIDTKGVLTDAELLMSDLQKRAYFTEDAPARPCYSKSLTCNPDGKLKGFLTQDGTVLDTCTKIMQTATKRFPDNKCLGWRPFTPTGERPRGDYEYSTYKDTWAEMQNVGKGIYELFGQENINVGIYGLNRPEWVITSFGLYSQNYRNVAIYNKWDESTIEYVVCHSEIQALACEHSNMGKVLSVVRNARQNGGDLRLKHVIVWDHQEKYKNAHEKVTAANIAEFKRAGIKLTRFSEVIANGQKSTRSVQEAKPSDTAFIMYSSGTTGFPKGIVLLHSNLSTTVSSVTRFLRPIVGEGLQRHVSWLPLSHIFEQAVTQTMLVEGGLVAYWAGSTKTLKFDWMAIKPTIVAGVPAFFDKMLKKADEVLAAMSCLKRDVLVACMKKCVPKKAASMARGNLGWDDVKVVVTGSAPISVATQTRIQWYLQGQGHLFQGFAMTETAALGFAGTPGDLHKGHCGVPFDAVEIRIKSAPSKGKTILDYIVVDGKEITCPRGEIQIRSESIMNCYFKNPKKTAETLTKDGWLRTGDLGRVNPNGTISIIGRIKDNFKLANGEYVSVEAIEGVYKKAHSVQQIWVSACMADRNEVVAVICPSYKWAVDQLRRANKWGTDQAMDESEQFFKVFHDIASQHKDFLTKKVMANLKECKEDSIRYSERIKKIIVETELFPDPSGKELGNGFTIDNSLATVTFKLRRHLLSKKYDAQFKALY